MSIETQRNPIWDAVAEEADAKEAFTPALLDHDLTTKSTTIMVRLSRYWMSGLLPALLLCLLIAVQGDTRDPGLLLIRVLIAPLVAWVVAPLMTGPHGMTPVRLLGAGCALLWVVPLLNLAAVPFYLGNNEGRGLTPGLLIGYLSDNWQRATAWGPLLLYLMAIAVSSLVAWWLREGAPWYDQRPQSRARLFGVGMLVVVPLVLAGWASLLGRPGPESRLWEAELLKRHPELAQPQVDPSTDAAWSRLHSQSLVLYSWRRSQEDLPATHLAVLRRMEEEVLSLREEWPTERWVVSATLGPMSVRLQHLVRPLEFLAFSLEAERASSGRSPRTIRKLQEYVLTHALSRELTSAEVDLAARALEALMRSLPDRVQQLDALLYSQRPVTRKRDSRGLADTWFFAAMEPRKLRQNLIYQKNLSSWLVLRPKLVDGASWQELENSPDRDTRTAAGRFIRTNWHRTQEEELKPLLEFYLLVYQILKHQLISGSYPESLLPFPRVTTQPDRWSWAKDADTWVLTDRSLETDGVWRFPSE